MLRNLWLYLATVVVFFAIDFVWLLTMTGPFYQKQLGALLSPKPNLPVAAGFYLVYLVGVIALCVLPGIEKGAWVEAAWRGALLGLVAYGTYDLTNQATIAGWAPIVTVVDLIWGTVNTAVVSTASFFVAGLLGFGK